MAFINQTAIWAQLHQHQRATHYIHMRDLFRQDPERFAKMHLSLNGLLFDYSKNRITTDTINLLLELAKTAKLGEWQEKMRRGDKINYSENRPVLHTALRAPKTEKIVVDGEDIIPLIHRELERALEFAERIREGAYPGYSGKAINHIINIGIGGSDLGPHMLYTALTPYHDERLRVDYVSNVDAAHLATTLRAADPERTLLIIGSKSFTTPETLLNAKVAKEWFSDQTGGADITRHLVAVTGNHERAREFGVPKENIFTLFPWVGGRYSAWSAMSLSVMCAVGKKNFLDFLAGGHKLDEHFFSAPFAANIPVLMGLIGVWYNTFYQSSSHAIIPYDHSLRRFPAHIQQVDMESNGKRSGRDGEYLDFDTGAIIWGEEGVNCQHAFFQLLHQGTRLVCSDFIITANSFYPERHRQHQVLVANALAQTRALMYGKTEMEVYEELKNLPAIERDQLAPQKFFPGNQPSNILFLDQLTPFNLGMLLALYEHKVFVEGIIWGINSFDQWGVEYGKVLARDIEPLLAARENPPYDSSTNHLIAYFRQKNKAGKKHSE